jgi:hypothetical protein
MLASHRGPGGEWEDIVDITELRRQAIPDLPSAAEEHLAMVECELAVLQRRVAQLSPLPPGHPATARLGELRHQRQLLARLLELARELAALEDVRGRWRKVHCTTPHCPYARRKSLGSRTGRKYRFLDTDQQVDAEPAETRGPPSPPICGDAPGVYYVPNSYLPHWRGTPRPWYRLPCTITCPGCGQPVEVRHEGFPKGLRLRQLGEERDRVLEQLAQPAP